MIQINRSIVIKKRTPDVVSFIFDVSKRAVKDTIDLFPRKAEDPFKNWISAFNREIQNLDEFLSLCVILDQDYSTSRRKPKTYISKVHSVETPEYKVKHVLDGLGKLQLLGNKLMLKEEISSREIKKVKGKKIEKITPVEFAEQLWEKVLDNDIDFALSIDECEYFERKREMIQAKKTEELLVAITNTYGSIVVYGITNEKVPLLLDNNQRDDIQNQITNICRNNIRPQITAEFKSIILHEDKGYLFIYVPKDKEILHTTNNDIYLKRVGSNNVRMSPDEVRAFYNKKSLKIN
ncbi:hypothetical protein ES705_06233 [subsurface metagenome]